MKNVYIKIFLILFLLPIFAKAQYISENTRNLIMGSAYTEAKGYYVLQRICDEAGGRIAGTPSNEKALNILQEELKNIGLTPIVERFEFPGWVRGEDEVEVIEPLQRKLRAYALGYSEAKEPITAEVVYAKYGFEDDYSNLDIKGKIVLVTQEAPSGKEQLLRYEEIKIAAEKGASAILFINDKSGGINLVSVSNFQGKPSPIPAFSLTLEEGKWLARLLEKNIKVKIKLIVRSYCKKSETSNIVVRFPGKVQRKIVVVAHSDSWDLGQGAVDNGYGTAILFDIARLIKKYSPNNYHTIELVWVNGEELGLWGSKEYAKKHTRDSISACINMDMTGSPTGINTMGFEEFTPFFEEFISQFNGYEFPKGVTHQPWPNSDHIPFIFEGIPAFTLHAFLEKDMYWYYHDFGDTFDKVGKRILSDASAIISLLTLELANNKNLPYIRKTKQEIVDLLTKYKVDVRLKRQGEWHFE